MAESDEKQTLHQHLINARGVLLWKLEGLSDCDIRRPMTQESIDGAAGLLEGVSNMPDEANAASWKQHYDKLDQIARSMR